jgi:RNA polymerase sigma factor (sigma-70 family)
MGGQAGLLRQIDVLFNVGALGHLPDAELLRRFVSAGREDAERSFEALVDRHGPMVMGVCRRFLRDPADAQDAFQATFLVLSRRAGQIGRPERLASWLYGVASRTSMKARAGIARRRRHERIAAGSVAEGRRAIDDPEIRAVLHEEIARLPEKYRAPVVLCHLEGMTRERASAHLRCPEATVGVRLMRARERLRDGLVRRGFAIAAGGLALDLGGEAMAALPPSLAASTASASAAFASRQNATAGAVSARTITLTRRVLRTMFIERLLSNAPALLLAGALAVGAGLLAKPSGGSQRGESPGPAAPAVKPAAPAAASAVKKGFGDDDDDLLLLGAAILDAESRWKKAFPGGVSVELLGVGSSDDGPKRWWTPEGTPLNDPPFAGVNASIAGAPGTRKRLLAVRVTTPPGEVGTNVIWEVPGSSALSFGSPEAGDKPVPPGVRGAFVGLPDGLAVGTIRVGIGVRPWAVTATSEGNGVQGTGTPTGGVVFSRSRPIPNGTAIAIAEDIPAREIRIVAIDRDGGEHGPSSGGTVSARSARMHDLEFALPPDRLREIRVLTRPYEWAEFRNVALDPVRSPAKP